MEPTDSGDHQPGNYSPTHVSLAEADLLLIEQLLNEGSDDSAQDGPESPLTVSSYRTPRQRSLTEAQVLEQLGTIELGDGVRVNLLDRSTGSPRTRSRSRSPRSSTAAHTLELQGNTEPRDGVQVHSLEEGTPVSRPTESRSHSTRRRPLTAAQILDQFGTIESDEDAGEDINKELFPPELPATADVRHREAKKIIKESTARRENRDLRKQGKEFKGFHVIQQNGKRKVVSKERSAVSMGVPCASLKCARSVNTRCCGLFEEEDRQKIFHEFWNMGTWHERMIYVQALVDKVPSQQKKRPLEKENSPRQFEYIYRLKKGGASLRVCRELFLSTLALTHSRLHNWLKNQKTSSMEKVNNLDSEGRKMYKIASDFLQRFLSRLSTLPSHYGRASSSLRYVEPHFNSITSVHKFYRVRCKARRVSPVSYGTFFYAFKDHHLAVHRPKKDQCSRCCLAENGDLTNEELEEHRLRVREARQEKERDKSESDVTTAVLTYDKMANKPLPHVAFNISLYLTKLQVNVESFLDLKTKKVLHYLWTERDGGLGASIFASIIVDRLTLLVTECPHLLDIILWSDGCAAQNKNQFLANALLWFCARHQRTVTQKFLEVGHTQMEVDSTHAAVERRIRGKNLYTVRHYVEEITHAREAGYDVKVCDHTFFHDYTKVRYYTSIRPGTGRGALTVRDMRAIRYSPDLSIQYKVHFSDDWATLNKKPRVGDYPIPRLYRAPLKITASKYKALTTLLQYIPQKHRSFYTKLDPAKGSAA